MPRFGRTADHRWFAAGTALAAAGLAAWRWRMTRSWFEGWGQWWLGVAAAALMLAGLVYWARKTLHGTRLGQLRPYYLVHVWAGCAWPVVVLLHADARFRGPLHIALAVGCLLVVLLFVVLGGLVLLISSVGLGMLGADFGVREKFVSHNRLGLTKSRSSHSKA